MQNYRVDATSLKTSANSRAALILKIYSCIIEWEEKRPIFMFDSSID